MDLNVNVDVKKYETKNPVVKFALNKFFHGIETMLSTNHFDKILEVGCGNGYVTEFLKRNYPNAEIKAIDINSEKLAVAKARVHDVEFSIGDIYDIKQEDASFDLVISTQVLEHLENPVDAIKELLRVSKKHVIVSVPNEPLYRISNMARLNHLRALGNTPGHINHWSKNAFVKYVNKICLVKKVRTPFPFTILLCEKR
jgi:ubiquinone/menaquinone biosynthesis C-methylase UbiE